MNCILDASSLVNLVNGGMLDTVLALPDFRGRFGPQVRNECGSIAEQLDALVVAGRLQLLNDNDFPAAHFLSLIEQYGLGPGETECLAVAFQCDDIVCCDDRRARTIITRELGVRRVIGSLGLLVHTVCLELTTPEAALAGYEQMRRCGGFLPELSIDDIYRASEVLKRQ